MTLTLTTKKTTSKSTRYRLFALSSLTLLLVGCGTVNPVPFEQDEIQKRVKEDKKQMYVNQEPITAPIDFHQAAARALKYNLDYKLKLMENALSMSLLDVAQHEMLPHLVATAGYTSRNNDSGGRSIGIEDRVESLRDSTSQERNRTSGGMIFTWNV